MMPNYDLLLFKIIIVIALLGVCARYMMLSNQEHYTNHKSQWANDSWVFPEMAPTGRDAGEPEQSGRDDSYKPLTDVSYTSSFGTTAPPTPTQLIDNNVLQDNPQTYSDTTAYSMAILPSTMAPTSAVSLPTGAPANYQPSYENTVNVSDLTGYSYASPVDSNDSYSGFCKQYSNDPMQLEAQCNNLDKNTCASTSCCVFLGNSKCVYGNEFGAYMKANYTDPSILNSDKYYYTGKCYGNCNNPQGMNRPLTATLRPTPAATTTPTDATTTPPAAIITMAPTPTDATITPSATAVTIKA